MTISEMSNEFDIAYNQVNSNQAASIDEYEKSVFLTKAQDELVKAYFDPRGNKFLEGFDGSEKRQYDFSLLVVNKELNEIDLDAVMRYDMRSRVYTLPSDLFLTLNESVVEGDGQHGIIYQVLPISYQEYYRQMQKPYQYPTKRSVWRLITGQLTTDASLIPATGSTQPDFAESEQYDTEDSLITPSGTTYNIKQPSYTYCEIIGRYKGGPDANISYKMRYVKKPTPIILVNLKADYSGTSIEGKYGDEIGLSVVFDSVTNTYKTYYGIGTPVGIPCYMPEGIHHEIVQRAVELATATYNPQALNNIVGVGNVSATNLGIVPRQENK